MLSTKEGSADLVKYLDKKQRQLGDERKEGCRQDVSLVFAHKVW
jgi:hypothetical protein